MSCGNYSFRMKEKLVVKVEKLLLLILIFTNFFIIFNSNFKKNLLEYLTFTVLTIE